MIDCERTGCDEKRAQLKETKRYRLNSGEAGIYQDGKIHSIDYPDRARFIRVTGTNLDNIHRVRFDLNTGATELHENRNRLRAPINNKYCPIEDSTERIEG